MGLRRSLVGVERENADRTGRLHHCMVGRVPLLGHEPLLDGVDTNLCTFYFPPNRIGSGVNDAKGKGRVAAKGRSCHSHIRVYEAIVVALALHSTPNNSLGSLEADSRLCPLALMSPVNFEVPRASYCRACPVAVACNRLGLSASQKSYLAVTRCSLGLRIANQSFLIFNVVDFYEGVHWPASFRADDQKPRSPDSAPPSRARTPGFLFGFFYRSLDIH